MTENSDYLIVGGGVAAGYASQAIRNRDKSGRIVMITNERHVPYDRTPLSKDYLKDEKKNADELYIKKDRYYKRQHIEIIGNHTVEGISIKTSDVTLEDGRKFGFKRLLLATGGQPRKLNLPGSGFDGVHYLRTIHDCDAIKEKIGISKNAVVIGGGFIGCELMSAFLSKGVKTTILEMGDYLLNMAVDEETGFWLGNYYTNAGAKVLTRTKAIEITGKDGKVSGVKTENGRTFPADLVCIGIGIVPSTELAERGGLTVDRGIVVNGYLETSAPGIFAAGDVARFFSPIYQRYLRVEHFDVAVKQGRIAGANMTGEVLPFDELPYFFSDQLGLEINAFGDLSQHTRIVKKGVLDEKNGFFEFYFDGERLSGVLAVNKEWEEIEEARDLVLLRKKYDELTPKLTQSKTLS